MRVSVSFSHFPLLNICSLLPAELYNSMIVATVDGGEYSVQVRLPSVCAVLLLHYGFLLLLIVLRVPVFCISIHRKIVESHVPDLMGMHRQDMLNT